VNVAPTPVISPENPVVAVIRPVTTAPVVTACTFTLPAPSFNAVASIPVKLEPSP